MCSNNSIRVFISYSHDSETHKKSVFVLSQKIKAEGFYCVIDRDRDKNPPQSWPKWMEDELEKAKYVLVICTGKYYERYRGKIPSGKGARWEGAIIRQEMYDATNDEVKFIPVFLSTIKTEYIPNCLRGTTYYNINNDFQKLVNHLNYKKTTTSNKVHASNKSHIGIYTLLCALIVFSFLYLFLFPNYPQRQHKEENQTVKNEIYNPTPTSPIKSDIKMQEETYPVVDYTSSFTDIRFRKCIEDAMNLQTDKNLYFNQIAQIEQLFCANRYIENTSGIEFLKNLRMLNISCNKLASLDLSNNKRLLEVYCDRNHISQLILPNSVQKIHCYSNRLETLDLSGKEDLHEIECSDNLLTRINIKNIKQIEILNCSNNNMMSISNFVTDHHWDSTSILNVIVNNLDRDDWNDVIELKKHIGAGFNYSPQKNYDPFIFPEQ